MTESEAVLSANANTPLVGWTGRAGRRVGSWPGATAPALRVSTCEVPAGSQVAVVGPSGAGKSTLLALLLGFLRPEPAPAQVPATVAWCPPEPHLLSTTVRENLRLGDPDGR